MKSWPFLVVVLLGLIACEAAPSSRAARDQGTADLGTDEGAAPDLVSPASSDLASAPAGTDLAEPPCFALSNDPDAPLAIDGAFTSATPRWRRPHDDEPMCPASALLPTTAAEVPYVSYVFCNRDTADHQYTIEWLAVPGPSGEAPLDDPYLVVYEGGAIPTDARQCRAVNDDIPETIDTSDAEVQLTVKAGQAITIVGTAYTFAASDGTGSGGYVMVVTNAD